MAATSRTRKFVITICAISSILLSTGLCQTEESVFELFFTRNENFISLYCRERTTLENISDAVYYFRAGNRSGFERLTGLNRNGNGVFFLIKRAIEGAYACGNNSSPQSNFVSLIAFPDSTVIPRQPPIFAAVRERVQVDCGIAPGGLLQHYFITWYKSAQGTPIVRQTIPDRALQQANINRYSLNLSSLSLIIDDVKVKDASTEYRCELTVVDPNSRAMQTYSYETLETNFITLVVLGSFRLHVDVTQEGDVLFQIILKAPLIEPVKLLIKYSDLSGTPSSTTQDINITTSSAYLTNDSFLHREYGSQVPFNKFRVGVRLVSQSEDTIGPLVQDPINHAKNIPTLVQSCANVTAQGLDNTMYIVGGATGFALLISVLVVITSIMLLIWACLKDFSNRKQQKDQREHERTLKQQEIDLKKQELELKQQIVDKPDEVVTEFLKQICDTETNSDEVRIKMIDALPKLFVKLIPRSAEEIPANGGTVPEDTAPAIPPMGESNAPENGAGVAVAIELNPARLFGDGEHTLGGPPPPPSYEQSVNHPVAIIKEQESPEVLEALQTVINSFLWAAGVHSEETKL